MSWLDRLRGRPRPKVLLPPLLQALAAVASEPPDDAPLCRARLADQWRRRGLPPVSGAVFTRTVRALDEPAWHRLSLLLAALEEPGLQAALDEAHTLPPQELEALAAVVAERGLLEPGLLASGERREELLRDLLERLGLGVEGESAQVSAERLAALDYAALLAAAVEAEREHAERVAYLEKLQAERPQVRRGKW